MRGSFSSCGHDTIQCSNRMAEHEKSSNIENNNYDNNSFHAKIHGEKQQRKGNPLRWQLRSYRTSYGMNEAKRGTLRYYYNTPGQKLV